MKRLTYSEYLALERETDVRHEFLDGFAIAMAGGSIRHAALIGRVSAAISRSLSGGPCEMYPSDLKVRVLSSGYAAYPDVAVICGKPEAHPGDRHAVTNPSVLVEVVSTSSEAHDRGQKFTLYRDLPAMPEPAAE